MSESLEEFYTNLLGIRGPWKVASIQRDSKSKEVTVIVEYRTDQPYQCPDCGAEAKLHDHRKRRWRHLDSCNHKTLIEADVPLCVKIVFATRRAKLYEVFTGF